jgi:hypothetical protein
VDAPLSYEGGQKGRLVVSGHFLRAVTGLLKSVSHRASVQMKIRALAVQSAWYLTPVSIFLEPLSKSALGYNLKEYEIR